MVRKNFHFCFLFIVLFSCSGTVPEPTLEHGAWAAKKWPGTNVQSLSQGRELYIVKCSGCHSVKPPSLFSDAEWDTLLPPMKKQAKLKNEEYEKIFQYVITMSKK